MFAIDLVLHRGNVSLQVQWEQRPVYFESSGMLEYDLLFDYSLYLLCFSFCFPPTSLVVALSPLLL